MSIIAFNDLPIDILRLIGLFSGEFYIFRQDKKICFKCPICYLFNKFVIYNTIYHYKLPLHVHLKNELKQKRLKN